MTPAFNWFTAVTVNMFGCLQEPQRSWFWRRSPQVIRTSAFPSTSKTMLGWVSLKSLMVNLFFSLCISYITFNSLIGSHFSMVWHLSWDFFLLVRICNCTKLGYCYMEPEAHSWKLSMGSTIGILAGIFGFIGKTDMLELILHC